MCLRLLKESGAILIGDIPNEDMNLRYQKTKNYKKQKIYFDKKRMQNMSDAEKKFFFFQIVKLKLLSLRIKNYFFYLKNLILLSTRLIYCHKKKELPYSVKRVDLLIKKRS